VINLIKSVYASYRGDNSPHALRISVSLVIAIIFGVLSSNLQHDIFPVIVSAISILAGFSFTALFSSHALAAADLPDPKNEDDRFDFKRLSVLSENFRRRSSYFIIISILDVLTLIACGVQFPFFTEELRMIGISAQMAKELSPNFGYLMAIMQKSLSVFAVFSFLEGVYTFYRLSETIIAMMDTRRQYLDASRGE
jgi:hypothetical protein